MRDSFFFHASFDPGPRCHSFFYRLLETPQDQFADFVAKVMTAAAKGHTLQTLKVCDERLRFLSPRVALHAAVSSGLFPS